jgi:tRNA nucleotidyltransferase (CCA-adding enzyme)
MGRAARLFNGASDQTLIGRVTPTTTQRDFLQEQWNRLADHLKQSLKRHGYNISTWLQGSYKYGTLIKPVRREEEYDVDVGVYFEGSVEFQVG